MNQIKWGFIGTGRIIPRFMEGFRQVPDASPAAIYGRNISKATALAEKYGFQKVFDDIDVFVESSGIDVAYIAVTHPLHLSFAKKCLEAGIPVVCEKPMAPNLKQEEEIVQCARKHNVFLMEGMWSRMFPITEQILAWLKEGRIGEIVGMNGLFCIKTYPSTTDRLYDPEQAGGALLDIGIYLVSLAQLVFGTSPKNIASLSNISSFGVDDRMGAVFQYEDGAIATLLSSFQSEGRDCATIYGTDGIIEIFEDFWRPRHARMTCRNGIIDFNCPEAQADTSVYGSQVSFCGEGYQFEINHVNECLRKGLKESPIMTLADSLQVMGVCDRLRDIWGLKYPFEK